MPCVTAQVAVQASLQTVFEFLADARNLPLWSSAVVSVTGTEAAAPGQGVEYRYRFPGRHHDGRLLCRSACRPFEVVFRGSRMWTPLGTQTPEVGFHLHAAGDDVVVVEIELLSRLGGAMVLFWPHLAAAWRRDLRRDAARLAAVLVGRDPEEDVDPTGVVTHVRFPGERHHGQKHTDGQAPTEAVRRPPSAADHTSMSTARDPRRAYREAWPSQEGHVGGDDTGPDVIGSYGAGDGQRCAREIGAAIQRRRAGLGMSQAQLAAATGLTESFLVQLEQGRVATTLPLLEQVAVALHTRLTVALEPDGTFVR